MFNMDSYRQCRPYGLNLLCRYLYIYTYMYTYIPTYIRKYIVCFIVPLSLTYITHGTTYDVQCTIYVVYCTYIDVQCTSSMYACYLHTHVHLRIQPNTYHNVHYNPLYITEYYKVRKPKYAVHFKDSH